MIVAHSLCAARFYWCALLPVARVHRPRPFARIYSPRRTLYERYYLSHINDLAWGAKGDACVVCPSTRSLHVRQSRASDRPHWPSSNRSLPHRHCIAVRGICMGVCVFRRGNGNIFCYYHSPFGRFPPVSAHLCKSVCMRATLTSVAPLLLKSHSMYSQGVYVCTYVISNTTVFLFLRTTTENKTE